MKSCHAFAAVVCVLCALPPVCNPESSAIAQEPEQDFRGDDGSMPAEPSAPSGYILPGDRALFEPSGYTKIFTEWTPSAEGNRIWWLFATIGIFLPPFMALYGRRILASGEERNVDHIGHSGGEHYVSGLPARVVGLLCFVPLAVEILATPAICVSLLIGGTFSLAGCLVAASLPAFALLPANFLIFLIHTGFSRRRWG